MAGNGSNVTGPNITLDCGLLFSECVSIYNKIKQIAYNIYQILKKQKMWIVEINHNYSTTLDTIVQFT